MSFSALTNLGINHPNNSEMCMWNLADGRCLVHNSRICKDQPENILVSVSGKFAILSGKSEELLVLSISNLEVLAFYF